jgi:hypothetical protein
MSTLEVGKIVPATGTAITLGDSGDTFTIPASATLDVNGAIDLTGATKTGFPAGGLTHASLWAVTADHTGSENPIDDDLLERTTYGQGTLGDSMVEAAGVFTFPSTGYWHVIAQFGFKRSIGDQQAGGFIKSTVNNGGAWNHVNACYQAITDTSTGIYHTTSCSAILDVTDTSNNKVSFQTSFDATETKLVGSALGNYTTFSFIKLADT